MELSTFIKVFSSLLFVAALFLISAWILKKYLKIYGITNPRSNKITINHIAIVDAKRRIIEVNFENKKFLLLLGNSDLVLDVKNIESEELSVHE